MESASPQSPKSGTPVKKVPFNVAKSYFIESQKILNLIEDKLPGKIMVYYVPEKYMILESHVDYFLEALKSLKEGTETINLILFSFGGSWEASLRIVSLIRSFCNKFNVIIPSSCFSAATKLALGADNMYFTPSGFISPVDTQVVFQKNDGINISQIGNMTSCDSIMKAMDLVFNSDGQKSDESIRLSYDILFKYMHPILIGDVIRLSKASERTGKQLMNMHPDSFESQAKITEIARKLVYDYPSHGYPIMHKEAKEIGLPAQLIEDKELYFLLWDLIKYYRAATRAVKTMTAPNIMHIEESSVVIETNQKRITSRYSFDQQFIPTVRKWEVVKDNSQWLKIVHADNPFGYKTFSIQDEEIEKDKTVPPESATPPSTF